MTILCRLLLVCVFALLGMRGANACEQMMHGAQPATAEHAMHMAGHVHCAAASRHDSHNNHDSLDCCHHAGACSQGCGSHCGALPLTSQVDNVTRAHDAPSVPVAALHAGITHAPPLPPPIV